MTPWTIQFMAFSRPEYWSGEPFPSPGDLPNPRIKLRSPTLQVDFSPAEPPGKPSATWIVVHNNINTFSLLLSFSGQKLGVHKFRDGCGGKGLGAEK